jgi:hypothetical protein
MTISKADKFLGTGSGYRCYRNYLIDDIVAFVYLGLKVVDRNSQIQMHLKGLFSIGVGERNDTIATLEKYLDIE